VHGDSTISTIQFAGILLRGNPIMAMGSVIRYHRARDEEDTVAVTGWMGQIRSRLTTDELLDSLADPRFNVRFEAILAIARMPPDPRLIAALVDVLQSKSPALSVVAAWAIGKMGAKEAVGPLRHALDSRYRSVQGYSARALATLGERSVAPELLERLKYETDAGLALAYLSALGKLGVKEALPAMFSRLAECDDSAIGAEVALAIARILGDERSYIQLARSIRHQPGTTIAQSLAHLRRTLARSKRLAEGDSRDLQSIEETFAREQLDEAARAFGAWLERQPSAWFRSEGDGVRCQAASALQASGYGRSEYLLLALHTLNSGLSE
jgi:HEAT repeat protein